MLRRAEELLACGDLDDLARVHYGDALRHLRDDAQVVRDEQDRHVALGLQLREQIEDLRLDGDIERGGRLIGDQHLGIGRERRRDHDALLLAARELERVLLDAALHIRDSH